MPPNYSNPQFKTKIINSLLVGTKSIKAKGIILIVLLLLLLQAQTTRADSFIDQIVERIGKSNLTFERSRSNIPFVPVSFLNFKTYGSTKVENSDGIEFEYDLSFVSQMAVFPVYIGENDLIVIGDYVSWSTFDLSSSAPDNFEVGSLGFPIGWLRQVNRDWQVAAFTMPFGHYSTIGGASWSGQLMSGIFGRYIQNDSLWWAFGIYSDLNPVRSYALPYLGASWAISAEWTVSLILPWPSVLYAPNEDWLFSLGATPSGASWSIESNNEKVYYNLDAWDLGLSIERRIHNSIWLSAKTGIGGLRSLRISESGIEDSEYDFDSSWFVGLSLNIRL